MKAETLIYGVVLRSPNGRDGWEPVKQADVPAWVIERMGMLVAGYKIMDPRAGDSGSDWYRFEAQDPNPSAGVTIQ